MKSLSLSQTQPWPSCCVSVALTTAQLCSMSMQWLRVLSNLVAFKKKVLVWMLTPTQKEDTYRLNLQLSLLTALPLFCLAIRWKEDYKQAASDELSWSLDRGWSPPRFGVDWRFQSQESSKPLAGDCSKELQPAMKWGGKLATHSEPFHILHRIRKQHGDSWW